MIFPTTTTGLYARRKTVFGSGSESEIGFPETANDEKAVATGIETIVGGNEREREQSKQESKQESIVHTEKGHATNKRAAIGATSRRFSKILLVLILSKTNPWGGNVALHRRLMVRFRQL